MKNKNIEQSKTQNSNWKKIWKILKTIGIVLASVIGFIVIIGVGIFTLIVGIFTLALADGMGSGMVSTMRPTNTRHSSYDQYKY